MRILHRDICNFRVELGLKLHIRNVPVENGTKQLCEIKKVCSAEIQVAQKCALIRGNVRATDEWRPSQSAHEESSMRVSVLNHYYNIVIEVIYEISNINRAFKQNSALKHHFCKLRGLCSNKYSLHMPNYYHHQYIKT